MEKLKFMLIFKCYFSFKYSFLKNVYILGGKKLQLTTPQITTFYAKIPRKSTPNYAETTAIYEKVRGSEHVCR